jgi:hypothetical protein
VEAEAIGHRFLNETKTLIDKSRHGIEVLGKLSDDAPIESVMQQVGRRTLCLEEKLRNLRFKVRKSIRTSDLIGNM